MQKDKILNKEDIKEYKFHSFSDAEVKKDEVNNFSFKELVSRKEILSHPEHQKIIRLERNYARETSFKISPIVEEQRGIKNQEISEYEKRVENEVNARLEKIQEAGFQAGFDEGVNQGREEIFNQMRASVEMKLDNFTQMLTNVLKTEEEILLKQKNEIYLLINNLTKWIVLRELKEDGKYIERLLEKILLDIQARNNLLVLVNANDWANMPEVLEFVRSKLGELKNVRVEVDSSIKTKGMVVESENGIINASLEEQFKSLDKLFEDVLGLS